MAGTLDSQKYCEECGHMQFDRSHVVGNAACTSVPGCRCKGEGESCPHCGVRIEHDLPKEHIAMCARAKCPRCGHSNPHITSGENEHCIDCDKCQDKANVIPDQLPEDIRNMKSRAIFKATVWSRIPAHAKEGLPLQRKTVPGAAASYEERRASGIHISGRVQISPSYMRHRNVRPVDKFYGGGKVKEGSRAWVHQPGSTYLHSRETKDWTIGHEVGHHLLATRHTNFGHKDYAALPPHEKRYLLRRMAPRGVAAYKQGGHHIGEEALAEGYSHFFNNKEHELKQHAPQAHALLSSRLGMTKAAHALQTKSKGLWFDLAKGFQASDEDRGRALDRTGAQSLDWEHDERTAYAHRILHKHPVGKPGLSVHRNVEIYGSRDDEARRWTGDARYSRHMGSHHIVYRDHKGVPVTAARISRYDGSAQVDSMVSDKSRGMLHGRGVFHVLRALHKFHATTANDLTDDSTNMVAHAFAARDKGSRAARAAIAKGYKMDDNRQEAALHVTGAAPLTWDKERRRDYSRSALSMHPKGKPGLTIHRHADPRVADYEHMPGLHQIVYRDHLGTPVTAATVRTHDSTAGWDHSGHRGQPHISSIHGDCWSRKIGPSLHGPHVESMASNEKRGLLHGRGVFHVLKVLHRMGATHADSMTSDSQRMVSHALDAKDRGSRAAKILG